MAQKTGEERIQEIETKINQLETRKIRLGNRLNEQKRKERTRRLIQVGAIFEKYFEIEGEVEAELIASKLANHVKQHKHDLLE